MLGANVSGATLIAKPPHPKLYTAAPITEAVAEVRFSSALDIKKLQSLSKKLARFYPNEVRQKARAVSVDFVASAASFTDEEDILKRSSEDEVDICVLRNSAISISRLAPYTQWSDLRQRVERDLAIALKGTVWRQVARVGLRYINRIDIPLKDGLAPFEDYLNLHIHIPEIIETIGPYALYFDVVHNELMIRIQSGKADAPVPNTFAVVLDIDVFKMADLPTDLPKILHLLDKMRDEKNLLFEAFVTNAARKLFDNA
jgi:uncharacterized protein (TIGR04255 family)